MGRFVINFRFEHDEGYALRHESFIKKVNAIATFKVKETPSSYAIEALGTAESIRDILYFETEFMDYKDQMIVTDLKNRAKATKGEIKHPATSERFLGF
ncbi:hypothetical protein [Pseudomonas phoenicis]|uniref:hypothetical protein n=1 Tax=unclassified Pseudomonas TaxID=196821 RepID=UPI0039A2543A